MPAGYISQTFAEHISPLLDAGGVWLEAIALGPQSMFNIPIGGLGGSRCAVVDATPCCCPRPAAPGLPSAASACSTLTLQHPPHHALCRARALLRAAAVLVFTEPGASSGALQAFAAADIHMTPARPFELPGSAPLAPATLSVFAQEYVRQGLASALPDQWAPLLARSTAAGEGAALPPFTYGIELELLSAAADQYVEARETLIALGVDVSDLQHALSPAPAARSAQRIAPPTCALAAQVARNHDDEWSHDNAWT